MSSVFGIGLSWIPSEKPICICRPNPSRPSSRPFPSAPSSAAARKLGKSQSTVSEAIARLEIDLGLELFDRSGRQPQLTEAGRTLLGRVEEVLGASDRLRRVAALLAGGSEPRVTLALSDTYHSARYEARLAELDERYPELEFECLIAEDQDVIAQVSRGRATLGLLAAQPHYPPELGVAAVAERAEFGLFAAVDHPLAGLERVSERDLPNGVCCA